MNKKQRAKASEALYMEVLRILVTEREMRSPKMTREELAEEFNLHPSTAMRLENGTYKLEMARFFEWCVILGLDPLQVLSRARQNLSK